MQVDKNEWSNNNMFRNMEEEKIEAIPSTHTDSD